jgi:hypothetical protein
MGKISYQANAMLVGTESNLLLTIPAISSFMVKGGTSMSIDLKSTSDTKILSGLGQAKAQKNITLFKTPSKDTTDSILLGLTSKEKPFGLNVDIYVSYTGSFIHMIHFFCEDAIISGNPAREGGAHKPLLLKIEFSIPKADIRKSEKKNDQWIDSSDPWQ